MRKCLSILVMMVLSAHATAQVVPEAQARQIAQRFATSTTSSGARRMPAAVGKSVTLAWKSAVGGDDSELYVYNVPSGGFIIVSGDEGTEREVLGWSDSGSFDADQLPDNLQYLVEGYAKGIAAYRKEAPSLQGTAASRPRRAPVSGYGKVEPLLKTTWGQDIDLYGHRYAGCVATAVAGILNYHRWPKQGYGSHTNFWDANHSIDFTQSSYAWGNMNDDDYEKRKPARQKLLNDIGCAVNMHYDQTSGSEAYTSNALKALVTNFGYDESRIVYGYASGATLRDELRAGRPVYYAGYDTIWTDVWVYDRYMRLPQNTISHAMIIDGFSDDGLFHIDFGWDGSCNGYFTMQVIRPYGENDKTHSYAPFGEMIYGIVPQKREKVKIGDIWYDLDDEASSAVVASSLTESYCGDVTIPPTVDYEGKTYAVNALRTNAFKGYIEDTTAIRNLDFNAQVEELPTNIFGKSLEGIAIRGNITDIPDFAFQNCDSLHRVVLGDNVKTVGRGAFRQCDIHELTLGKGLETIGEWAFSSGYIYGAVPKNLTALELPASLKEIGEEAFWGNGIKELTLPAGVKCGRGAFGQCYSLSKLTISEGVTEIADSCFIGNGILTLDVPASVTRIGRWALSGSKMFRLTFHSPSFVIDEHAISSSYLETFEGLEGCTSIATEGLRGLTGTFTVNPTTTYADKAVVGDFDKIIIPAAATDYNPLGVSSAKYYIVEPGHPTLASAGGFLYNNTFSHLYIVPDIDESHWDIYIPRSVKTISSQPFEARWLRVWLPEGLQSIDARWIDGLDLRDVYCPAPVPPTFLQTPTEGATPYMNYHARLHVLPGCAEAYKNAPGWKEIPNVLEDLVVDDGFVYQTHAQYDQWEKRTNYWAEAISHRSDAHPSGKVIVPTVVTVDGQRYVVTTVNPAVFQGDATVKDVTLGSFVGFLYDNAFRGCESLRRVSLGENITWVNISSFEGCTALEEVEFKAQEMTDLSERAFAGCTSLRELNLPAGITNLGKSAFEGCTSLKVVRGLDNVRTLPERLFAGSGIESFTLGKDTYMDIFSAGTGIFLDCPNLHTLAAHPENTQFKGVDGILYSKYYDGTWMLYQCPPLVKLANGVIADREVVNFSEELSRLGQNTLPATVREVILPASLTQMNWQACALADKLEKVTCLFTDPSAGSYSAESFHPAIYATATLQVPKGSKEKFQSHYEFKKFAKIVEIAPDDYPSPEQIQRDAEKAQEDDPTIGTALTLLMKDGTTHIVRLVSQPVISMEDSNLRIMGRWLDLSLPLSDVVRYTFESYDFTDINETSSDGQVLINMENEQLVVSGLKPGESVSVFDLQGRLQRNAVVTADSRFSLSLGGLPAGVYVVKANEITYKFMKR